MNRLYGGFLLGGRYTLGGRVAYQLRCVGLGLAWPADDTAPHRLTAERPFPEPTLSEAPRIPGVAPAFAP